MSAALLPPIWGGIEEARVRVARVFRSLPVEMQEVLLGRVTLIWIVPRGATDFEQIVLCEREVLGEAGEHVTAHELIHCFAPRAPEREVDQIAAALGFPEPAAPPPTLRPPVELPPAGSVARRYCEVAEAYGVIDPALRVAVAKEACWVNAQQQPAPPEPDAGGRLPDVFAVQPAA